MNIDHDNESAIQVKSWYDIKSFVANKQVDSRSAADARAQEILESTTIHNGQRYDVGKLLAADNTKLLNIYFSSLGQLKSLEKRLFKDEDPRENYFSSTKKDLNMGYVIEVPDAHKVFDPLDLVAPFTVGARRLLKDIWRATGHHWDDELPPDKVQRFLVWSTD